MQDKSRKNSYLYFESQIDRFYHLFEEFFRKIKEDAEQKAKEEKKQRRINYWLLFVNFVIVICTIVIVFKTISAVSISRENLNKFKEFTKKNNRAYLSIGEASFQKIKIGTDSLYQVKFSVKNSGNTPALNVRERIFFEWLPKNDGPETIPTIPSNAKKVFYNFGDNWRVKRLVNSRIDTTKMRFFYGRIEYSDIFDQLHCFTFCYQYIAKHDKFVHWEKYNEICDNP